MLNLIVKDNKMTSLLPQADKFLRHFNLAKLATNYKFVKLRWCNFLLPPFFVKGTVNNRFNELLVISNKISPSLNF